MSRQQRGVITSSTSKANNLTQAGDGETFIFCRGDVVSCAAFAASLCLIILVYHARYERQEEFSIEDESDWDARARWMKSSFPRPSWPWFVNEG